GEVIAAGYDAELDELWHIGTHTEDFLLQLERRERERTGLAGLKLGYNRVQGFFIEIARRDAERVPKDYIRRQTVKSAERFITSKPTDWGAGVRGAREEPPPVGPGLHEPTPPDLSEPPRPPQPPAGAPAETDSLAAPAERACALGWPSPKPPDEPRLTVENG